MYGNCASCGFPVHVRDANPVSCPFCAIKNQPVASPVGAWIETAKLPIILAAIVGIIMLVNSTKSKERV